MGGVTMGKRRFASVFHAIFRIESTLVPLLLSILLLLSSAPTLQADVLGTGLLLPQSPRSLGMGGAYIAVAAGADAIYYNPANLKRFEVSSKTILVNFSGVYDGHTRAIFDFLRNNVDEFRQAFANPGNPDLGFYGRMAPYDRDWGVGDFAFRFVEVAGSNRAFSVYNANRLAYRIDRGLQPFAPPEILFSSTNQIVTSLTYCTTTPLMEGYELLAGTTFRYLYQRDFADTITDAEGLGNLVSPIHPSYILENSASGQGFAIDLGWGLKTPLSGVYVTAVVQNAIARIGVDPIPRATHLGASYELATAEGGAGITVAVQLSDIFQSRSDQRDGVAVGGELRWKGLSGRAGLNKQGPTFGAGFDTRGLHFNYALTREKLIENDFERERHYLWIRFGS
jgi:hypothetical protein